MYLMIYLQKHPIPSSHFCFTDFSGIHDETTISNKWQKTNKTYDRKVVKFGDKRVGK